MTLRAICGDEWGGGGGRCHRSSALSQVRLCWGLYLDSKTTSTSERHLRKLQNLVICLLLESRTVGE